MADPDEVDLDLGLIEEPEEPVQQGLHEVHMGGCQTDGPSLGVHIKGGIDIGTDS